MGSWGLDVLCLGPDTPPPSAAPLAIELAAARLRRNDQLYWLRLLAAEHENLHGALRWTVGARDVEMATRLAAALGWYWLLRGHNTDAQAWYRQVVRLGPVPAGYQVPYAVRVVGAAMDVAGPNMNAGGLAVAVRSARRLVAESGGAAHPVLLIGDVMSAVLGGDTEMAEVLVRLAHQRVRAGDLPGATADVARARRLANQSGQPHMRAFVLLGEAELAYRRGDFDEAERLLTRAWERYEHGFGGPPQFRAIVRSCQARLAAVRDELCRARELAAEPLDDPIVLRDGPVTALLLETLAEVSGDAERAAVLLGTATSVRGLPDEGNVDTAAVVAAARGALGADRYAAAYARGAAMTLQGTLAYLGVTSGPAPA